MPEPAESLPRFETDDIAPLDTIQRQHRLLIRAGHLVEAFEAVPGGILILNRQRQIVFANRAFCSFAGVQNSGGLLLGLRPGEAVGCLRVSELGCRCGTTEHCRACGAVEAILESQKGEAQVRECRILTTASPGALDLRVRAAPFRLEGEEFTLFFIQDISDEKRRAALERIFFHDVLNTAGNIRSVAQLLHEAGDEAATYQSLLDQLSDELLSQIQMQRELVMAEAGELRVHRERVDAPELLRQVAALYAKGRVRFEQPQAPVLLSTDRTLLSRVLANMVKNAIEAAEPEEMIRAGLETEGGRVTFWVNNRAVLPPKVRLQIFQRSFSTKGAGRGLGTYSMKLLGERYLGGAVTFTSTEAGGTTFRASFPTFT